MTMKRIFLLSLCLTTSLAFTPVTTFTPTTTSSSSASSSTGATITTALHMAASSSFGPKEPKDGWTGKPGYVSKSTKPVPMKNISPLQRLGMKDVMIEPNYFLTWAVAALGPLIIWYHPSYAVDGSPSIIGLSGGIFHMLFAALLWVQTRRVRLVMGKDSFEFFNIKGPHLDLDQGAWLEEKPANYVSGTQNKWSYDSIINYGFFPSIEFPVIVYFKETATPPEKWNRWFAAFDSYGRGQPHFFPGICDVYQFKEEMEARGARKKDVPALKNKV